MNNDNQNVVSIFSSKKTENPDPVKRSYLSITPVQHATCVSIILQNADILQRAGFLSGAELSQITHMVHNQHAGNDDTDPPLAS